MDWEDGGSGRWRRQGPFSWLVSRVGDQDPQRTQHHFAGSGSTYKANLSIITVCYRFLYGARIILPDPDLHLKHLKHLSYMYYRLLCGSFKQVEATLFLSSNLKSRTRIRMKAMQGRKHWLVQFSYSFLADVRYFNSSVATPIQSFA